MHPAPSNPALQALVLGETWLQLPGKRAEGCNLSRGGSTLGPEQTGLKQELGKADPCLCRSNTSHMAARH